ncbi:MULTISPECIES: nucleoside recognition domain-containing protein [unclassified Paenibacillus]|uniref:nucleoside recognition domain-containing protein n=1 Tax=unclassified Paenibacillus TaxID=185978 RepID=UPI0009A6D014|nr:MULTISPECIES: nucleoside recognition domain-containing protein [unclassified Paenibacillus]SLK14903.1 Nucleoside recognition [Paenibacillus sp. RU5A]SOC73735.1 Nucleoside recognition [Paenibacillus sp. RU26A]SOC75903.1 Nucleoside recognition [Paenibacillus sp. RU5M]
MLNSVVEQPEELRKVVLVGFESAGKSALFRGLTGRDTGEESNVRGSTVTVRRAELLEHQLELLDTPGIRMKDDSVTTMLTLNQLAAGDTVILVIRGTDVVQELPLLLGMLDVTDKNAVLVLTFADKCGPGLSAQVNYYRKGLGISVLPLNTREMDGNTQDLICRAIVAARPMKRHPELASPPESPVDEPQTTMFEHTVWGRFVALAALVLLFAAPVYVAYLFSGWIQPLADAWILEPLHRITAGLWSPLQAIMLGDYGMISLGLYSFIWAFPVVFLIGFSVAATEESGLKDRITDSLDGWMRKIGMNGKDLIPVLSGFGCNVVAVFQSRTCSSCTRKACVSLISFGSACSYQIGASLSIFSSGGKPWLFFPYMLVLVLAGAIHTRLWNRNRLDDTLPLHANRTFLQKPSWRSISWRVRSVMKQFLVQAMPIFIGICVVATLLEQTGVLSALTGALTPILAIFHLPGDAAGGILFSILRKDGLLVLNQDQGSFVEDLSGGQLFILVYLASTLTACLVTMWTIRKELGAVFAMQRAGKQLVTSLGSAFVLAWLWNWIA